MIQEVQRWFMFKRKRSKSEIRLRLFLFPPAGGDVATYLRWEEDMPEFVETCFVRLPGRGARFAEPSIDRMDRLIHSLSEEIKEYTDIPYVLFGHSMGGLVVYELARRMQHLGWRLPEGLVISCVRAPHHMNRFTESLTDNNDDKLYMKSDAEFLDNIVQLGGIPGVLRQNRDFLEMILPTFRRDMKLCETYQPENAAPLPISIEVYGASRDHLAKGDELEGWKRYTSKTFALTMFQGNHFYFADQPGPVLAHLRNKLIELDERSGAERTSEGRW
ncbi:thioesterase [Paenibacillus faecis]|uniref:Thioesterase n=1 Tax=Paenibacillus faecis TaxID=862114 RepID=A0A5D0CZF3_9BACL|nr:alpha/beta fold hydrolase [Paenibacillus faecis]TYA15452.1 thioesterase [Paenibacillus faecis]